MKWMEKILRCGLVLVAFLLMGCMALTCAAEESGYVSDAGVQIPVSTLCEEETEKIEEAEIELFASTYKSGDLSMAVPTKLDLAIMRSCARQLTYSTVYSQKPSAKSPYKAGALSEEYLQCGLAYFNYIRYAAGLPEAVLNESWTEAAQYGAVVMAANDKMSHYPTQPSDMPDSFFEQGRAATSTSNICYHSGTSPKNYCISSLNAYMDDESSSNMSRVGHRRWLLNPLKTMNVGFGEANNGKNTYTAAKVFHGYGSRDYVNYRYVAWPAAGYFPNELLATDVPWSVTVNPSYYKTPQLANVQVTITRASDGKSWTLDQSDNTEAPVNTKPYFNVETNGYGVSNCIIFHPGSGNWGTRSFDGIYTVEISGLYAKDGTAISLTYDVEFFDISKVQIPNYRIKIWTSQGGKASFSSKTAAAGSSVTFTVTPDEGYELAAVRINGKEQPVQSSYTLKKLSSDMVVDVLFRDSATGYLTDGTFYYTLADGEMTLVGPVNSGITGRVAIPSAFGGYPVTAIGDEAFRMCGITGVIMPDTITKIGARAFRSSWLTGTVKLPKSVTSIGIYAFSYATRISAFEIDSSNKNYMTIDGVLFEKTNDKPTTLLHYPPAVRRSTYVVPSSVTVLYCTSFGNASGLKTLYAANPTLRAMTYTFFGCTLDIYARSATKLCSQIKSGLDGTLTYYDIAKEPTFTLQTTDEGTAVRVINLSNAAMKNTLVMAGYEAKGKFSDAKLFALDIEANDVDWIDTEVFTHEKIKFFHVTDAYRPLRGMTVQK